MRYFQTEARSCSQRGANHVKSSLPVRPEGHCSAGMATIKMGVSNRFAIVTWDPENALVDTAKRGSTWQ
jgi:hypothetical protein